MKIFKTLMAFEGDNKIFNCDTISHEGRMWLVGEWLESPNEGWTTPARLVCLDLLQHQKSDGSSTDFVLSHPIPKSVFDGQIPTGQEDLYLIMENSGIRYPIGNA